METSPYASIMVSLCSFNKRVEFQIKMKLDFEQKSESTSNVNYPSPLSYAPFYSQPPVQDPPEDL